MPMRGCTIDDAVAAVAARTLRRVGGPRKAITTETGQALSRYGGAEEADA